ncbi:MAG: DJ-1/PfpI family protein [Candidatus Omnitrophica bacterium]|nr:DJ-1/PfpI family protein [Candidatus Omnitrophota bacterium]
MRIKNEKVLMVVAHQDFRDEEYQEPREILENAGVELTVASSKTGIIYGSYGLTAQADILLNEVNSKSYGCVIFVGGMGSSEYFDNPKAHLIIGEMFAQKKLVCAICIAPNTLAQAGILKGKRVTAYPSVKNDLIKQGAIYSGKDVEVDGNIITANGPQSAKRFAETIIEKLAK